MVPELLGIEFDIDVSFEDEHSGNIYYLFCHQLSAAALTTGHSTENFSDKILELH